MYIDAIKDAKNNKIHTVNRVNGERIYKSYPIDWSFYYDDSTGEHMSWYNTPVKKVEPTSAADFKKLVGSFGNRRLYESDVNHVFRCLEQHYPDTSQSPDLHVAFFDIETDFDEEMGYSSPTEAFNPITSIAVYLQWCNTMVCLAVPPPTLSWEEAKAIAAQVPDVILCATEKEMLQDFLSIIEDADVLSGWNSAMYDIPYTIHRLQKTIGGEAARQMCLWGHMPQRKKVNHFGKEEVTYSLIGRQHLDYLDLYKKYTYEEKQSYKLNSIAEAELGEQKVEYQGTLDDLYKKDFKKFLEYNIQDTKLLDSLDEKLKYIDLVNTIAHNNQVPIQTALGTVSMMEQVITVEAHNNGFIVPDKRKDITDDGQAAGGWVSRPKKGLHRWVGSSDLNSLYPSVIRAFNMSPETIVGQVDMSYTRSCVEEYIAKGSKYTFSGWWNDRFNILEMEAFYDGSKTTPVKLHIEDNGKKGPILDITGRELRDVIFSEDHDWCISANGTIFDNSRQGTVPSLLSRWYNERKQLQKVMKRLKFLAAANYEVPSDLVAHFAADEEKELTKNDVYDFPLDAFDEMVNNKDVESLKSFMDTWGLTVHNGHFAPCPAWKTAYTYACDYWDKQQLVRKINLNSCYGGLLNAHMKFYDQRIGQSTTLSGRSITRHMTAKTAELLEGKYDIEDVKSIIYNDTDSVYFSVWPVIKDKVEAGEMEWNKDIAVKLYDDVSDQVSDTFPEFLKTKFNVPEHRGSIIASGREIVAESGLYITKKRYAALVYDDEGVRRDTDGKPGKLKAMGLDLRRSDTPVYIQEFLKEILLDTLQNKGESYVVDKILDFKKNVQGKLKPWQRGVPKAVNGMYKYTKKKEQHIENLMRGVKSSLAIPGHVQASFNWNELLESNGDMESTKITDGTKVIVCYLKTNERNYTSVAYPVDQSRLPTWFTDLPFDVDDMEERVLDKKVSNLLSVLKWDLSMASKQGEVFGNLFTFN